jgi:hypothetical protein
MSTTSHLRSSSSTASLTAADPGAASDATGGEGGEGGGGGEPAAVSSSPPPLPLTSLWGWGWNMYGQVGIEITNPNCVLTPLPVPSLCQDPNRHVLKVAAGGRHSLACIWTRNADGGTLGRVDMLSWGRGDDGQLGTCDLCVFPVQRERGEREGVREREREREREMCVSV